MSFPSSYTLTATLGWALGFRRAPSRPSFAKASEHIWLRHHLSAKSREARSAKQDGADGGTRTLTPCGLRILSPVRLNYLFVFIHHFLPHFKIV
jgi:hypothetical protein